ncbi:hypothetical protein D3C87_79390 [compost metagenome]
MRKAYCFYDLNYSIFMRVDEKENAIEIYVCEGFVAEQYSSNTIHVTTIKKKSILNFVGFSLERRTQLAMRKAIKFAEKNAKKRQDKNAVLYKAYNETKEIFTLDEHLDV